MIFTQNISRIIGLIFAIFLINGAALCAPKDRVPGRLVVQTTNSADPAAVTRALSVHGARVHDRHPNTNVWVLDVPDSQMDTIAALLGKTGLFTFVEPDYIARKAATPNDPDFASQWYLNKVQAPNAWDMSPGSSSVVVAVIDSGVDPTHPDLVSKLVPGWNFITGDSNTADTNGHGTETAGVAGAATNNYTGIAGVAGMNPIMPLVACDAYGNANYSNIANAITYAADHGARIISISLIGVTASSVLQNAVDYAWGKGAVIFAGTGNFGDTRPNYPAACDNVVAVSATDANDNLAYFSTYGSWIDLSAPGTSILTSMMGGGYSFQDGTSFSTPIAAAVGALVLSMRPSMTNTALVSLLEQTADDLGAPGFDPQFGWGRVNAYKALNAALSAGAGDTMAPSAAIGSPGNGAAVSGTVQVQGSATDNVGVIRIDFLIDGAVVSSATTSPFSFAFTSTGYVNGAHQLAVNAYDAAGNRGSVAISVNVGNITQDTTAPAASISSPANGVTVAGSIQVQGTAADNVGVARIDYLVDGAVVSSATASPFSFTFDPASRTNGTHQISINAYDAAGNKGSAAISVNVNNTSPDTIVPSLSISSPANGAIVSGSVNVNVSASDNVGVTQVAIYIDGVLKCTDTSAPYTYSWNTKKVSSGSHTIKASAWDKAGNMGTVSITVKK